MKKFLELLFFNPFNKYDKNLNTYSLLKAGLISILFLLVWMFIVLSIWVILKTIV